MKQSKNSNFKIEENKRISLEDFIFWCIETATDLAVYQVDNNLIERINHEIKRKYNLYGPDSNFAVARLFNPVFEYFTKGSFVIDKKTGRRVITRKALIPHDGYMKWNPKKKLKALSLEKKKKISQEIAKECRDYYKENIKEYALEDKISYDI